MAAKGICVELATPRGSERWRVTYRKQSYWADSKEHERTIYLRPGQTPTELADSLIHEAIHISTGIGFNLRSDDPIEVAICHAAADAVALLLKMGLLVTEDEDG